MDNKDAGSNLTLWVPGGAVVLSLVVSAFALTRTPFVEPRPAGGQFQVERPVEARLWQDPFDALERYRKKLEAEKPDQSQSMCDTSLSSLQSDLQGVDQPTAQGQSNEAQAKGQTPSRPSSQAMVVLVPGGPYADELEQRRRIRYAVLAGFQSTWMKPVDAQHFRCLKLAENQPIIAAKGLQGVEIPYEVFRPDPMAASEGGSQAAYLRLPTVLFWLKESALGSNPLATLNGLRQLVAGDGVFSPINGINADLKVIGPVTATTLGFIYSHAHKEKNDQLATEHIEIYSPLVTVEKAQLVRTGQYDELVSKRVLRTTSDDGVLAELLLNELVRRRVDVSDGVACEVGVPQVAGRVCPEPGDGPAGQRVALITEWDSFYARALSESFKTKVVEKAGDSAEAKSKVDDWVLRYSYLRGLDGKLPEDGTDDKKDSDGKDKSSLDLSPLEKPDGNSQLDYLRRLADHIANQDRSYRRAGLAGIDAIGVLGSDSYDKLLALQALKERLPDKVFFSTNLDARMLQRGQAQTARNLVLAAPYGLTLTRELQQDVPPFRDSAQSATYVAVLAAQSNHEFSVKRALFEGTNSLLSPSIYEVGMSGFIPLGQASPKVGGASCDIPESVEPAFRPGIRATPDIMGVHRLQDLPPPVYPEVTSAVRDLLNFFLDYFYAKPLAVVVLVIAVVIGYWWSEERVEPSSRMKWVYRIPFGLFLTAVLCLFLAKWYWQVVFMWMAFLLIVLGGPVAHLIQRGSRGNSAGTGDEVDGFLESPVYYVLPAVVVLTLVLLLGYQMRRCLTENGAGEPMFLFEGISSWPTIALRCLALVISLSALAWGWRNLRVNSRDIQRDFSLPRCQFSLLSEFPRLHLASENFSFSDWLRRLGRYLFRIFVPLSSSIVAQMEVPIGRKKEGGSLKAVSAEKFWNEHCLCGSLGARLVRSVLATWIFIVITSLLYVFWPMNSIPIRGWSPDSISQKIMTLSYYSFYLLVFWVVDANFLLVRFIRQLVPHQAIWSFKLRMKHKKIFGVARDICIDDWADMVLIAQRSSAVNRLIYAPTIVLLILIASRSSVFDNWLMPPSAIIIYAITVAILFSSALSLRRAAEKARGMALQRIDEHLLEERVDDQLSKKLPMVRERILALSTGAFSRYSDEPLVRALLLSLTGIGGSFVVDALNFAKF